MAIEPALKPNRRLIRPNIITSNTSLEGLASFETGWSGLLCQIVQVRHHKVQFLKTREGSVWIRTSH